MNNAIREVRDSSESRARLGSIDLAIVDEYVCELERGNLIPPAKFLALYPGCSPDLIRKLSRLADLQSRLGLWSVDLSTHPDYPAVGETICGYSLIEEIGSGAFSRVYLAVDEKVGHRRVAVKFTSEDTNELTALGPLVHPYLPRILASDFDSKSNHFIICMEYVGRRTLADRIEELHGDEVSASVSTNTQSWREMISDSVQTTLQVADGLAYVHEHGVLHLDIKPGNIVLREDNQAVLIDFNLSAPIEFASRLGFRGTLAYAAPEVIQSAVTGNLASTPISAACDVYSLGVILYELLTGRMPWHSGVDSAKDMMPSEELAKRRQIMAPSEINPVIDRELDEIIMKALAWLPDNRFSSGRSFHDELSKYTAIRQHPTRTSIQIIGICLVIVLTFILFSQTTADHASEDVAAESDQATSPLLDSVVVFDPTDNDDANHSRVDWEKLQGSQLQEIMQLIDTVPSSASPSIRAAADGYVLMLLEDYGSAADSFRVASARTLRNDVGINVCLAYCFIQQRQYGGASRYLDMALAIDPENVFALFLRSIVELEMAIHFKRPPSLSFIDRLVTADKASSCQFVQAAVQYCERRVAEGTFEHNVYLGHTSKLKSNCTSENSSILTGSSESSPLVSISHASAAGVDFAVKFNSDVEDYLDDLEAMRAHFSFDGNVAQ